MPGSSVEVRRYTLLTHAQLVEHFFRHEYGRLVAMLGAPRGSAILEDVEDAVQSALMTH